MYQVFITTNAEIYNSLTISHYRQLKGQELKSHTLWSVKSQHWSLRYHMISCENLMKLQEKTVTIVMKH